MTTLRHLSHWLTLNLITPLWLLYQRLTGRQAMYSRVGAC